MSRYEASNARSVGLFVILVFVLTVPFWLASESGERLMPGLPLSALAVVCPAGSAMIVAYWSGRYDGIRTLFAGDSDNGRIRRAFWCAVAFLLPVAIAAISFRVLRFSGIPVPGPSTSFLEIASLCVVFFCAAIAEEVGWTTFATPALQDELGFWRAGLLLGAVWAAWHFIPLRQADRSWSWIAWWSLGTVASRVIIVALWNASGRSTLVAAVFHMSVNVNWQLFPVHGSYYDPRSNALVSVVVALIVGAIVAVRRVNVSGPGPSGSAAVRR